MKKLSTALGILSIAGIVSFTACTNDNKANSGSSASGQSAPKGGSVIAYVNLDSLEANYEYLKSERSKFEQRQEGMKAELERSAQQLRNDYANAQRKMQSGTMTQAEAQTVEKRLMQMQESLKTREEALTVQLMKEQDEFNKKLQDQLDKVLADYNKDKKYDYILSYAKGGSIMYANKDLDITNDVLKAMNEESKNLKEDAEKKNK
jgi:outer membrane protein